MQAWVLHGAMLSPEFLCPEGFLALCESPEPGSGLKNAVRLAQAPWHRGLQAQACLGGCSWSLAFSDSTNIYQAAVWQSRLPNCGAWTGACGGDVATGVLWKEKRSTGLFWFNLFCFFLT